MASASERNAPMDDRSELTREQLESMIAELDDAVFSIDFATGRLIVLLARHREDLRRDPRRVRGERICPEGYGSPGRYRSSSATSTRHTATGIAWRGRHRVVRPDGEVQWVYARIVPAMNAAGEVVRVNGVITDIDDMVRGEEAEGRLEGYFRALVQNASDIIMAIRPGGAIAYASPSVERLLGLSEEDLIDKGVMDLVAEDDREMLRDGLAGLEVGQHLEVSLHAHRSDGALRSFHLLIMSILTPEGETIYVVNARDLTEHDAASAEIERSERYFRALVQNASDAILTLDAESRITYASPSVERTLGYLPEELAGRDVFELLTPDEVQVARNLEMDDLIAKTAPTIAVRALHKDGSTRYLEVTITNLLDDAAVGATVINVRDVTERRQFEEDIARRAFYDELTGLPNRSLLLDRIQQALARGTADHGHVAVLALELDRFKLVSDTVGHATSDDLLVLISKRLLDAIPAAATLARTGEDSFAIVLADVGNVGDAMGVAEDIIAALETPFQVDGGEFFVAANIGLALAAGAADRPEDVVRNAGLAMARAKAEGKCRYALFQANMDVEALDRLLIESELRHAVERGELHLRYQPIVSLRTGRLAGIEALVRWQHPRLGLVGPNDFIPLAEEIEPHLRDRPVGVDRGVPAGT